MRASWWLLGSALIPGAALSQVPAETAASPTQPDPANVQPAGDGGRPTGRRTYDVAYFAQYTPSTALQVVERVPGFAIEAVDPTVRGFGQAAGNVVINGQRPSTKSETLQTLLSRIPATRVLRVEIGPGDQFGTEYTGKAQVANLVLTAEGGLATTIDATVRRDYSGRLYPSGSLSTLLRDGASTFNAALTLVNDATGEEGTDRVTRLSDGVETEFRRKVNRIRQLEPTITAGWNYNGGTNRTANVTVRAGLSRFALDQRNDVFPIAGPVRDDFLTQRYHQDEAELGGDVTRPLWGGGIKLIGLATRRYRDDRDFAPLRVAGAIVGGFEQTVNNRTAETLGRLVWSRGGWGAWNVEVGAEGVVNQLDSSVDLFSLAAGGGRTRVDLPVDQARVREVRGEAFVNAGRPLTPTLRADASLTVEASRLTVSGDAEAERTLKFLKPKLVLDWRPSPKLRAQLTLQRTVAQLQFEDFISSAELASEQVNGGNAELLPQRSWEALATIERPILGDGVVRLELGYNRVSKVQDRVPTPEGFDAPGNLGTGETFILRNRIEAPLKSIGFTGGRLILYGSYIDTSVRDPYTFDERPFSGNSAFFGEATLRQDRTKFAWGITLSVSTRNTVYRRNELDRRYQQVPNTTAFVEWRPSARTVVTAKVENALDLQAFRERLFYAPDRTSDTPVARELRERNRHVVPSLSVRHVLG